MSSATLGPAPAAGVLGRVKRANARLPPEDSIALRVAVTVAVLASGTATIRQGVGGTALMVACVVGIPAAMAFSHLARHREGFLLKAFLAVGILVAFANFLASLRGLGTGLVSDVQVPLAELFLWTQLLHSLDVPARRDLQFSLVSSLVLVAIAGVLSVSMALGLHLVIWAIAGLTAMVLSHRSELRSLPVVRPSPRPTRAPPAVRVVAVTLTLVLVLGVGAFLLVPPSSTAPVSFPARLPAAARLQLQGGLSNPSLGDADPARANDAGGGGDATTGKGRRQSYGYFGFSDRLDTSVRGRPDQTLVMRVRSPRADFWRGGTFDRWDGRTWTATDERPTTIRGPLPIDLPPTFGDALGRGNELVQTYYVERAGPNMIFAAAVPDQLYFPDNAVFQRRDGTLRAGVELAEGAVYTVISHRLPSTPDLLRAATPSLQTLAPAAAQMRQFLTLPPSTTARVRRLAEEVTASSPTVYDKVRALEGWMAEHTRYSLDAPRLRRGADAVDQFLFEDRLGFCEQIGSSLVVMLRHLGVPARLAVGYAAGERNPFTGLYEVRASDAHAWAEVWFPGIGWQAFDPTASVPLAGEAGPRAAGAGLARYLNARLPALPGSTTTALLTLSLVVIAGAGAFALHRERRRRRALLARSWSARLLDRLEAEGAARGRPRPPSRTARAYVLELRASVLPDPRLVEVANALELEQFSGDRLEDPARARAEAVVEEVLAAWPARDHPGRRSRSRRVSASG